MLLLPGDRREKTQTEGGGKEGNGRNGGEFCFVFAGAVTVGLGLGARR